MSKKKKNKITSKQEDQDKIVKDEIATKVEPQEKKKENVRGIHKSKIILGFAILLLLVAIGYFVCTLVFLDSSSSFLNTFIPNLLLVFFSILFVALCFIIPHRKKGMILFSTVLLILFFSIGICNTLEIGLFPSSKRVENFVGKSLVDVISWAQKNHVSIEQEYEYSDMIPEYSIISQDIEVGTKLKDIQSITIAVSEGANPEKEVIVPNMVSWDSERVLTFIQENYLSNVSVEFVESDKAVDTVIEQDKSGNLKRNEEIQLTFSLGEELNDDPIKLIDLLGKSKFEAEFYLKQNRIRYELEDVFSKKVKRGYVAKQSVDAATMVKPEDETVTVSISKGPKIQVPDLKKMSMTEITEWVIENKLKLTFSDRYDDSVSENQVLDANYSKGDTVEQGTVIEIILSKGSLKMPKFSSYQEFKDWADKYEIRYEEKHEFSSEVRQGEVISYSYQTGEVIKNDDVIIVTISDGAKLEVPDLEGLNKSAAITQLKKVGLDYNFVYKSSTTVAKDKVISQSIAAGSEVSEGTTITVTLSSGKSGSSNNSSNSNANSSSSNSGSNNNSGSNSSNQDDDTPSTPECISKTYTLGRDLNNIFKNYSGFSSVQSALYSYFSSNYPNVNISVVGVDGGDATSGSYIGGIGPGSEITSCNGVTYTIEIAK